MKDFFFKNIWDTFEELKNMGTDFLIFCVILISYTFNSFTLGTKCKNMPYHKGSHTGKGSFQGMKKKPKKKKNKMRKKSNWSK